jgi:molybdate transport system substrate-binding protein
MKLENRISQRARRDFTDIREYLAEHNLAAAGRLYQHIGRAKANAARAIGAAICISISTSNAQAETVRVLSAGAAQAAIKELAPAFASATGHTLDATFDTVGALRERALAGEKADVLILSVAAIAVLEKAGKILPNSAFDLGSIAVAMAVRKGAHVPDATSSPEALKRTLLAAKSIAHADPARGATAGAHFAGVLERLGIADAIRPRVTVLGFGGDVVEGVAQGRFEIGVSQASEIIAHSGVTLVGALPEPLGHRTRYLAAIAAGAGPAARTFLQYLAGLQARAAFKASGFDAP